MTSELARARGLLQADRYEDCEAILLKRIAAAPEDRDAHFLLAQLRHIRGDADFAGELRKAAGRRDASPRIRAQYADILRRSGQCQAADAVVRGLIASEGPHPQLLSSLATVLQEMGRFDEAVIAAGTAYAVMPADPAIAENYVACLLSTGDPAVARPIVDHFRARVPEDQRWITYRGDVARQAREAVYDEWCDLDRLVRVYDLGPPPGHARIADFHAELAALLDTRHRQAAHPLDQSLRGGTQTSRGLLGDPHPLIVKYFSMLAAPLAEYQAAIGFDAAHPMLGRNRRPARPTGCWSVRLGRGGYHVNHIHPRGWISSAYYVAVPAEAADATAQNGWLKFCEPRFPMPGGEPRRTVQPLPGRLVLFPSYLWHGTRPVTGAEPRLSIAFDCLP